METADMPDGFVGPDWWQTLYDDTVAALLLVRRDPAETTATVRFLVERRGGDAVWLEIDDVTFY